MLFLQRLVVSSNSVDASVVHFFFFGGGGVCSKHFALDLMAERRAGIRFFHRQRGTHRCRNRHRHVNDTSELPHRCPPQRLRLWRRVGSCPVDLCLDVKRFNITLSYWSALHTEGGVLRLEVE